MAEQPSHVDRRPYLSITAAQYAKSYALTEKRSLSNAASELIRRGAESWLEQRHVEPAFRAPTKKTDDRESFSVYINRDLVREIKRIAYARGLSASHVAEELLFAGMEAKAAATAPATE